MKKRLKIVLPILLLIVFFTAAFLLRVQIKEIVKNSFKPELPQEKQAEEFVEQKNPEVIAVKKTVVQPSVKQVKLPEVPKPIEIATTTDKPLPATINLSIPFASQAPFADWNMPYQEACEEASAIMVSYYFLGKDKIEPAIMDAELLALIEWENKTFGYYQDTNAEEIARILREYFKFENVEVRYDNFTIEDIKKEVAAGNPVILPAAGRILPNPNFRQPGPVYHALVVKGYTKTQIITNDPGTRNGKDFLYFSEPLMNAVHEWNSEDILLGRKAMIVVKPNASLTK